MNYSQSDDTWCYQSLCLLALFWGSHFLWFLLSAECLYVEVTFVRNNKNATLQMIDIQHDGSQCQQFSCWLAFSNVSSERHNAECENAEWHSSEIKKWKHSGRWHSLSISFGNLANVYEHLLLSPPPPSLCLVNPSLLAYLLHPLSSDHLV